MKLLRFRKLFAIVALTVMVLMVLATGVSAAEEKDYTNLDDAIEYLDEYTYHINHVSTQLPYALTVAGVSFVSFIVAGIIQNVYISLAIAVVLMIGTLFAIKFITQRAKTK